MTITPLADAVPEFSETVVITVIDGAAYNLGSPETATVTIVDAAGECGVENGTLLNGGTHCGAILTASEVDTWTFTANAGDRIAVHVGEVVDNDDFRPWIRLSAPTSAILGSAFSTDAAEIGDVIAPVTGTYLVLVASADLGVDGTGTYRLTMTHTPGPITVSAGDQGGPLTNGALHTGEILQGDLDVWTFTATAGDRIAVHIGEIVDDDDFRPWIRLWAPNGATLGSAFGTDAAAGRRRRRARSPAPTWCSSRASTRGFDGTGTYRLTMTHTPGPITVSPGDQGGPLTNGGDAYGRDPAGRPGRLDVHRHRR